MESFSGIVTSYFITNQSFLNQILFLGSELHL